MVGFLTINESPAIVDIRSDGIGGSRYHAPMSSSSLLPPARPPTPIAAVAPFVHVSETRRARWLWLISRVAIVLFLVVMGALLWLSNRTGSDEQKSSLIGDMLWLEQVLHFQLARNEELLGEIGPTQAKTPETFNSHARTLLGNQSGLRQIRWFDAANVQRHAQPYVEGSNAPGKDEHRLLAKSMGKAVYGEPYLAGPGDWRIDVYVPLFRDDRYVGLVVGTYAMQRMLEEAVPWWLMEKYRVVVVDTPGQTLASRSKVDHVQSEDAYQIAFDPPGHGLFLQGTPYATGLPLAKPLLSLSLVVLAASVLWSLWALRRHVRRRLAAEGALRQEYAFRMAMEDSLQTGLRARDLTGRITYVNPAFCRMVGWSREELIGALPPMPYWVDEDVEATFALNDRILAGEGPSSGYELQYKRRNGEVFPALVHTTPLIDAQGHHTGWMSSIVDISDRKRAEERERQQQEKLQTTARLVTMGEMASSLAHELNQPLAAIASYNTGCLNLLSSGQEGTKEMLADIETVLRKSSEQAQRAGRIIRRIYEFARRSEPKDERFAVAPWLDEVQGFIDADLRRRGIVFASEIDADLPPLRGDRVLLSQTLLNLLRNAIDAMRTTLPEQRHLTLTAQREAAHLHLQLTDRGCGISVDDAARLFEPFYTTKAEGMGMGLAICRSVVEGHHGRLWHEPNVEGGTIFHVLLPLAVEAEIAGNSERDDP